MYLRRKIDDYLETWKNAQDRKPLIIQGARQIGKTESILRFARSYYEHVVYLNFALERKYAHITDDGYGVGEVIRNISLVNPSLHFVAGHTVIIFDELQEYPDMATTLKSFCLDGRFDVICSGSMLGVNYRKIHSNSVGYKIDYEMRSMDFEEFLWARGYQQSVIDDMLGHMTRIEPFSDNELRVFRSQFFDYCVLGGMPAVVREYIESGTFSRSLETQRQLLLDYEEDVRKYVQGIDQTRIISVLRSVPFQLAKENKKFQFSRVDPRARSREYSGAIDWLSDAGVIVQCHCLMTPELPLAGNADPSRFKVYYPDTGLLVATLDEEAQEDLRTNRNLGVYKGALYENFVAEAFVKQGLGLFYYRNDNSSIEEDFFVRTNNELIPVEVKSNTKPSRSLTALVSGGKHADIRHGIKLGDTNVGYSNRVISYPYFCAFLIKRCLSDPHMRRFLQERQ